MEIISFHKTVRGLILETSQGRIKVEPCSAKLIHVVYTLENEFSLKESLMILSKEYQLTEWNMTETADFIVVKTSELSIEITKKTGAFLYRDRHGELLTKEPERGGKTLIPIEAETLVYDDTSEIQTRMSVDGVRAQAANIKQVISRKAYHTKLEFVWDKEEALYGLGSHEEGIMNLRGSSQYLYQQNMKAVVPVLISTKGYGIVLDSYGLMTFHDDAYGSYLWTDVDDELDYYFIYGPEMDQIVTGFRALTGSAPMLPRWAFGYAQSKERYESQAELISIVQEYRKRKIPIDLIILDWRSWTGDFWGQKSFDPVRFPDPKAMMREIHQMDARLMVSIWPIMSNNGPNHVEMKEQNCLLGNRATYDAFNDKARELYWRQANEGLFAQGIDAWWCDCTEPFEADWNGEVKPEPEERLKINTGQSKKYLDPEYINAYSLLHSKGIYEGQRGVTGEKRVVNLTRSSYAGQQRYSAITWSGDTAAKWETLKNQIPAGLNFCITGVPYWTSDIGAFFVARKEQWFWNGEYDAGCEDPGYRELYVRWFQYGAFLPMFRSHGTDTPREVWRFGEPGSPFYETLVKFIRLRYRLMPYIYSLAGWVTHFNYTMLRALPFDFRQDPKTYDIADQFMFGPAFLVNPVTEPMYYHQGSAISEKTKKTRAVYLPAGTDWYDFWTGSKYGGGQTIETSAELEIVPLFIRSGVIIPLGPDIQHTGEQPDAALELRIYTGKSGSFVLYEDEGDSYRYENSEYATIAIHWDDETQVVTFDERKGSFRGMVPHRIFHIRLISDGIGFAIDEDDSLKWDQIAEYDGTSLKVEL